MKRIFRLIFAAGLGPREEFKHKAIPQKLNWFALKYADQSYELRFSEHQKNDRSGFVIWLGQTPLPIRFNSTPK